MTTKANEATSEKSPNEIERAGKRRQEWFVHIIVREPQNDPVPITFIGEGATLHEALGNGIANLTERVKNASKDVAKLEDFLTLKAHGVHTK